MLSNILTDLCIVDGGADSHVGGKHWLPLTPLSGPNVRLANVTGFDDQAAKKFGLPIVEAVLKVILPTRTVFLRTKHLIYNATSRHTLLSNYQMRECALIVDEVHKRHYKDEENAGTHSIRSQTHDCVIPLMTRGALPTFDCHKPTMEEWNNAKEEDTIDIAIENWDPREHHEDMLKHKPAVHNFNGNSCKVQHTEEIVDAIANFQQVDTDPLHLS